MSPMWYMIILHHVEGLRTIWDGLYRFCENSGNGIKMQQNNAMALESIDREAFKLVLPPDLSWRGVT